MDFLFYVLAGAGVGLAVGLTGVGGGSLMTPLLILWGVPEKLAIGTDLLYAAVTKFSGGAAHAREGTVNWRLVGLLAAGSIPASLITSYVLYRMGGNDYGQLLTRALGLMLVVTALVLIFRSRLQARAEGDGLISRWVHRHAGGITLAAGLVMGVVVTLSSVGAGAFCAVLLLILYPHLPAARVVGTDIAHAVPLTLIGGLGHWLLLDNVDFALLGGLLLGSIPAVHLGARLARQVPNRFLQPVLAALLFMIGSKFLFLS